MVLRMNKAPKVLDTSDAAWRRLRYIEFNVQIATSQQNERLADELLAQEGPGILNWMLEGWHRVRPRLEEGKPALITPQSIMDATNKFRANENQAVRFFEDEIEVHLEGTITTPAIMNRYRWWCEKNGEFPMNGQRLIIELERHCSGARPKIPADFGGHNHHPGEHRGIRCVVPAQTGIVPTEAESAKRFIGYCFDELQQARVAAQKMLAHVGTRFDHEFLGFAVHHLAHAPNQ